MANNSLLSPAELSYLHQSLSLSPPVRADNRSAREFRPVTAEVDFLPSTYGSARAQLDDGSAAIVGVKADVEKTRIQSGVRVKRQKQGVGEEPSAGLASTSDWIEVNITIPETRSEDSLPAVLGQSIRETLQASGHLLERCQINSRFHWKIYIDVLLLSNPTSYPLPLLSLTTYLALASTRLPAIISQGEEDVMCNDDWETSEYLYPRSGPSPPQPPISILVLTVGGNIIFDPTESEVAVADTVMAVSFAQRAGSMGNQIISMRLLDPPPRHTLEPLADSLWLDEHGIEPAQGAAVTSQMAATDRLVGARLEKGWSAPVGGLPLGSLRIIVDICSHGQEISGSLFKGLERYLHA